MTEPENNPTPPNNAEKPKNDPPAVEIDPLLVDYANDLKSQLGELYDTDLDKLPLKDQIASMKLLKKASEKLVSNRKSEGKSPIDPTPEPKNKVKDHVTRYAEGWTPFTNPNRRSIFSITTRENNK